MATKRAGVLTAEQFATLMGRVSGTAHPERDRVMLLLSFKCGLRACEIARLKWDDVTDAEGNILKAKEWIELGHDITKGKKPDTKVAMHPELVEALVKLRAVSPNKKFLMYAPQAKNGVMSVSNVTVYLYNLYKRFGFSKCSSHTGRRTFITTLARVCNEHKCSIKDVQELARHSDLRTTEKYIEPSQRILELASAI